MLLLYRKLDLIDILKYKPTKELITFFGIFFQRLTGLCAKQTVLTTFQKEVTNCLSRNCSVKTEVKTKIVKCNKL